MAALDCGDASYEVLHLAFARTTVCPFQAHFREQSARFCRPAFGCRVDRRRLYCASGRPYSMIRPELSSDDRVVILGAGPTGLGAAYRLKELGHTHWHVYDQAGQVG